MRTALATTGGEPVAVLGRDDDPTALEPALDLVVVAVPDHAIAEVAALVPPGPLVVHLSGVTGLAPLLTHHQRCGSLHPLVSLPDPVRGARALLGNPHVAIAAPSPESMAEMVALADRLGAQWFVVDDEHRGAYHAAASIAANHLVALLAQVERVTSAGGMPLEPFTRMMQAVITNVESSGAAASLTGPVARSDWDTVRAHLMALDPAEHSLYLELAQACAALAGHQLPADLAATAGDVDSNRPIPPAEVTP